MESRISEVRLESRQIEEMSLETPQHLGQLALVESLDVEIPERNSDYNKPPKRLPKFLGDEHVVFDSDAESSNAKRDKAIVEILDRFSNDEAREAVNSLQLSSSNLSGSEDGVEAYLKKIGTIELLRNDEKEIFIRIEKGLQTWKYVTSKNYDPSLFKETFEDFTVAYWHAVVANSRLAVHIAKSFKGRGLDLEDLIQEANLGLLKAVNRFDYKKGFKFSTFATWWISQGAQRAVADRSRTIRIPVHAHEAYNKIRKTQTEFEARYGVAPTIEQLAEETQMPMDKITTYIKYGSMVPASMDATIAGNEDSSLSDFVEDPASTKAFEEVESTVYRDEISRLLKNKNLSPRQKVAVCLYYEIDLSLIPEEDLEGIQIRQVDDNEYRTRRGLNPYRKVAKMLGISHEQARLDVKFAFKQMQKDIDPEDKEALID
jgi:RNA polymerase primary sigma factor